MKVCPTCRQLVESTCVPCKARQRADYDRSRKDEPHRKLQKSWRWIHYSKWWLASHPFCGEREDGKRYPNQSRCVQEGLITAAEATDHIIPTSKGGSVWNPANHQSLCFNCNTAKGNKMPDSPHDGALAVNDPDPVMA